jgi:hypothetical protein
MLVPAPLSPELSLFDRPLVEMLLAVPLSLLGAAGFAGFVLALRSGEPRREQAATILMTLAVAIHGLSNYSFYPSPCCNLVGADNLVALDWLEKHAALGSRVAIATARLGTAPPPFRVLEAPTDAGAWIRPLSDFAAVALPRDTDFRKPAALDRVCARSVTYVYVGNTAQSFNSDSLQLAPAWYRLRLQLPSASIYEVTACRP